MNGTERAGPLGRNVLVLREAKAQIRELHAQLDRERKRVAELEAKLASLGDRAFELVKDTTPGPWEPLAEHPGPGVRQIYSLGTDDEVLRAEYNHHDRVPFLNARGRDLRFMARARAFVGEVARNHKKEK